MSTTLLRLLESVHGHLGALAAVALLHPAILLWRGRPAGRGARWSIGLTALLTTLAFGGGILIYADYRRVVKRALFRQDMTAGFLFETKEHLALVALCLCLGAVLPALARGPEARERRRLAARLFAASAALAWLLGGLGVWVHAVRGF